MLQPVRTSEKQSQVRSQEEEEVQRMLDKEKLERSIECLVTTAASHTPHIHGVEPWQGSRFWALGEDEESDEESKYDCDVDAISSPQLIQEAMDAGFTVQDLEAAEKELISPNSRSENKDSISTRIISNWVQRRRVIKPWSGPLPKPRISPKQTIGDAIAKAKYQVRNPRKLNLSCNRFRFENHTPESSVRRRRLPEPMVTNREFPLDRVDPECAANSNSNSNSKNVVSSQGHRGSSMGRAGHGIKPRTAYKRTPGLVALFSRTGTETRSRVFDSVHTPPPQLCTYAEVVRGGMENGGAGNVNRGGAMYRGGNRGGRRGSGQGWAIGRGGFQGNSYALQGG